MTRILGWAWIVGLLWTSGIGQLLAQETPQSIADNAWHLFYIADYEGAFREFTRAGEASTDPLVWVGLGRTLNMLEEHAAALTAYQRAVSLEPSNTTLTLWQAVGYARIRDFDRASIEVEGVVNTNPSAAWPVFMRGYIQSIQGNHDAAIADINRALEMDPGIAGLDVYERLGIIYARISDYDKAIQNYDLALGFMPDHVESLISKANLYRLKGDLDTARTVLGPVLTNLNPNSYRAYSIASRIAGDSGDFALEERGWRRAIELLPQGFPIKNVRYDYTNSLGLSLEKQEKWDEAVQTYSAAIAVDDTLAVAWRNRGWVLAFKLNQTENALADLQQALTLDPNDTKANRSLGEVYSIQGQFANALPLYCAYFNNGGTDSYYVPLLSAAQTQTGISCEIHQWAARAQATSSLGETDYSAGQATGAPNAGNITGCGDSPKTWASLGQNTLEQLTLIYAIPVIPSQVNVYQNNAPGALTFLRLSDSAGNAVDVTDGGAECVLLIPLQSTFAVNTITLNLDQSGTGNRNQIDAVELIGRIP